MAGGPARRPGGGGGMDVQNFLPFYRTLSPVGAAAQKVSDRDSNRDSGSGKETKLLTEGEME